METPSAWEDRLARWQNELQLFEQLEGTPWVTLAKAEAETGVSRSALRSWYRNGEIQSRDAGAGGCTSPAEPGCENRAYGLGHPARGGPVLCFGSGLQHALDLQQ